MWVYLCWEVTKYVNVVNQRKFIRKDIWFVINMNIISTLALMTALRRKLIFTSEVK